MGNDEKVEAVLAHYGIKGMRWGVRRSSGGVSPGSSAKPSWAKEPPNHPVPGGSQKLSRKDRKAAAKELRDRLSEDAIVFNALKEKARKEGIHALSNSEIKVLTARAEALDKFHKTFPKQKSKRAKVADFVVQDLLVNSGKQILRDITKEQFRKGAVKKGFLPEKGKKQKDDDD
jgi:hypothetical protein